MSEDSPVDPTVAGTASSDNEVAPVPRQPHKKRVDGSSAPVKVDFKTRVAISAGGFLIRMLARTWRMRSVGREHFEEVCRRDRGVIFTFWHGQMLPLAAEHGRPTNVLISDHRDGEIITQIIRGFGLRAIRGSSSRGAARALLQLSRTIEEGGDIAITPDGPRGPRHTFAPGALVLAQRTGAPIILLSAHANRSWILKTWDAFEIPKPFARVTVVYDAPRRIEASDVREAAAKDVEMATALNDLNNRVRECASDAQTRKRERCLKQPRDAQIEIAAIRASKEHEIPRASSGSR